MGDLIAALVALEKLPVVLFIAVIVLCWMLYRGQRKNDKFDLRDLVLDTSTKRISLSKFGQLIALAISSWGFLYLALNGKLTEMYFTTYMAAWSGIAALNKAITAYQNIGTAPYNSQTVDSRIEEEDNEDKEKETRNV